MGNQTARMDCPLHQGQKIRYLCTGKKCIEPLCQVCSKLHRQQHEQLGFSPSLIPISQIVDKHQKYQSMNKALIQKDSQIPIKDGEYIPTGFILKKLTRQYFAKRFQNKKCSKEKSSNSASKYEQNRSRSLSTPNLSIGDENKRMKMVKILQEHEIYHRMQNNKKVKAKIQQFLKQNLILNEGVVGKEYSHLYE